MVSHEIKKSGEARLSKTKETERSEGKERQLKNKAGGLNRLAIVVVKLYSISPS